MIRNEQHPTDHEVPPPPYYRHKDSIHHMVFNTPSGWHAIHIDGTRTYLFNYVLLNDEIDTIHVYHNPGPKQYACVY